MKLLSLRYLLILLSLAAATGCGDDGNMPDCTVGDSCNDGDPLTTNDVYNSDCDCVGTPVCTVGASCNDGDNTTIDDEYNADCECEGTPTACTGIGDADGDGICFDVDCDDADELITTQPGDACDDGDPNTDDDTIESNCECEGTCTVTGQSCDDGDPETYDDAYDADCECAGVAFGNFTDTRDGQSYRTIEIGTQTWMADNMNYIGGVSWCFANTPANCDVYGRLYDWETATEICPTGWHLPNDDEWDTLINYLGGPGIAGGKMKEEGTEHWNVPNTGATNSSGWTGLPGGFRLIGTGEFNNLRANGTWWSLTEDGPLAAWHRNILFGGEDVAEGNSLKGDGFSVRCIKD